MPRFRDSITLSGVHTIALIPAAGHGVRMGAGAPKQFLMLAGRPILFHTLERFERAPEIDGVIVISPPGTEDRVPRLVEEYGFQKILRIVPGGEMRQDSVRAGLAAVPPECELVAVHDGVRPLVTRALIARVVKEAEQRGAAVPAIPAKDTVVIVANEGAFHVPKRETVRCVQTPQVFRRELLERAMAQASAEQFYGTDEASLVERLGEPVYLVPGEETNIKITTPEDVIVAEALLTAETPD